MNEELTVYLANAYGMRPQNFPTMDDVSFIRKAVFEMYPDESLDVKKWDSHLVTCMLHVLRHVEIPSSRLKGFSMDDLWKLFWQVPSGRTLSYIIQTRPTSLRENNRELLSFYWPRLRGTFENTDMEEKAFYKLLNSCTTLDQQTWWPKLELLEVEKELMELNSLLRKNDSRVSTEQVLRWEKRLGSGVFMFHQLYVSVDDKKELLRQWPLSELRAYMMTNAEQWLECIKDTEDRMILFQRLLLDVKTADWWFKKTIIRPEDCVHVIAYRKLFRLESSLEARYRKVEGVVGGKRKRGSSLLHAREWRSLWKHLIQEFHQMGEMAYLMGETQRYEAYKKMWEEFMIPEGMEDVIDKGFMLCTGDMDKEIKSLRALGRDTRYRGTRVADFVRDHVAVGNRATLGILLEQMGQMIEQLIELYYSPDNPLLQKGFEDKDKKLKSMMS